MTYDINYDKKDGSLNLFAWHEVENYGDKLGPALFYLLNKKPVHIEADGLKLVFDQGEKREVHCFLGTLAHLIYGPHHFIFWGFGSAPAVGPAHHGSKPIEKNLDIEFRALRGPLTRQCLLEAGHKVPESMPYGDPGLLVPYFFRRSSERIDDFCIAPHHSLYEEWKEMFPRLNVIDIGIEDYDDIQKIISEITKYKIIFSASLHVTILAESFGIPTIPIEPRLKFKFDDFYAACGKKVRYVEKASPNIDWDELCKETLRNWQPIKWDPAPFLDAAPFKIEGDIKKYLVDYYKKLSNIKSS